MTEKKGAYPSRLIALLTLGGIITVLLLEHLTGTKVLPSIIGISLTLAVSYIVFGTKIREKIIYWG